MINKKLLKYAAKVKSELCIAVILKYLFFFANLLFVFAAASLLESVLKVNADSSERLSFFIAAALIAAVTRFLASLCTSRNTFAITKKVQNAIRSDIYVKILDLGAGYLEKSGTSQLVSLAIEGVEMLEVYFGKRPTKSR